MIGQLYKTPPLNPCRCGASHVTVENYHDNYSDKDVTYYRCPKCDNSHKGAEAWNAANPPIKPAPRTDGEAITQDLQRAAELLREVAEILERVAGMPR